jgi:hypothetical protein
LRERRRRDEMRGGETMTGDGTRSDDTARECAKCKANMVRIGSNKRYYVTPSSHGPGMLETGSGAAWQCIACGSIAGDAVFVEMNRAQRREQKAANK